MRSGKIYLRTARTIFSLINQGTHAIVNPEAFTRDHLFAHHDPFSFHVQANGHPLLINRLNHAADNFTQLFFEINQLGSAFCLANALLDHLTRGLCGYPAKISWSCLLYTSPSPR